MAHVSDFTQDEDKIILDLVNYDNQSNLSKEQVAVGPVANTANESTVSVSAKAGSGYVGAEAVSYKRLDIAEFVDVVRPDPILLQQGNASKLSDFLPELNALLGTAIQPNALIESSFADHVWQPNEQLDLSFAMNAFSKVYKGSFPIKVDANEIPLNSVISKKVLSGLHLPGYVEGPLVYLNAPLKGEVVDESGNASTIVTGFPNGNTPAFEDVNGEPALRLANGRYLTLTSKEGSPHFLSQARWKFSFEVMMINPALFKHEGLMVLQQSTDMTNIRLQVWKRAQSNNRVIVGAVGRIDEKFPVFADSTTMAARTWRKFTFQRDEGSLMVKFFVNDLLVGEQALPADISGDHLRTNFWISNPNTFDGYIRNILITEY